MEKTEVDTKNVDSVKYIEKKLVKKGVQRLERRPSDGLPLHHYPKKGHGGKYTWEGPNNKAVSELDTALAEEEEEEEEEGGVVVGEVEVAKLAEQGVARVEVDTNFKTDE